ncbi:MAG: glycosyltransferase family 4 protein [Chloroflexi bacterium]|nr:glycosyltransferase family 4 protein [Chloroflexota bacterium]
MVSFQRKLEAGLRERGIPVSYDPGEACRAALVIGGTRQLGALGRLRRRGVRIVQRLDGMNWMHRLRRTGLRHYVRAEYGNLLLAFIRARLAHRLVYQSRFSQAWWERVRGPSPLPSSVVLNGVDLTRFTPQGEHERPADRYRLLLVEGSLLGGYDQGLETAVALAEAMRQRLPALELMVAGRTDAETRRRWEGSLAFPIHWAGVVPAEDIPQLDRSAHLLFSADIHPACPNAAIEALACGLPVVAFDTGALPELVGGDAGRVVPYGGDAWRLQPADIPALAEAGLEILAGGERFRRGARQRAEQAFDLNRMVEGYVNSLFE